MSAQRRVPVHNATAYRVHEDALEDVVERARRQVDRPVPEVSLAFVEDGAMVRLHEEYYGKEGPTDVLAFPYGDETGEIVINPSFLRRVPGAGPLNRAVTDTLVHAMLHLAGFDHTQGHDHGVHFERQDAIMERLRRQGLPTIIEPANPETEPDGRFPWG